MLVRVCSYTCISIHTTAYFSCVSGWLLLCACTLLYMTKTTKVKTAVSVLMFSLWRSCYKRIWTDAITNKRSTALMLKNDDENCAAIVAVVPAEETRKIRDRGALAGSGWPWPLSSGNTVHTHPLICLPVSLSVRSSSNDDSSLLCDGEVLMLACSFLNMSIIHLSVSVCVRFAGALLQRSPGSIYGKLRNTVKNREHPYVLPYGHILVAY